MKKYKVGLLGVGGITLRHIPAWLKHEDAELVAMCDIRPEQMEKYPEIRHYTDYYEMMENEELDILDIALPTFLHAQYAEDALNRGLHVFCEKPISLKKEDVQRLYSAAEKNNVCFMVGHSVRFGDQYQLLRNIIKDGRYGKLLSGKLFRLSAMPNWSWDGWMQDPKRSGGVACDLHIHDLDFMVYALGAPKSHKSYRTQYPGKDYIFATYDYGDFFVNIEAAWYGCPHPFHSGFSFQFEKAVITWDKAFKAIYLENGEIIDLSQPEPEALGGMNIMNTPSHEREFKYFVDCIKAGKPADMIKPEELEAVLSIIETM